MAFLTQLRQVLNQIPKQIEVDSPYLTYPPPNEEKICRETFQSVAILFKQSSEKFEKWESKLSVCEFTPNLLDANHFVLKPVLEKGDPFSEEAKATGCYTIRLKEWSIVKGAAPLSEAIHQEALQGLGQCVR